MQRGAYGNRLNMGVDRFTKYQNLFGFGQRTNIDLPGESSGLVYSADNMSEFDLAINAFGQTLRPQCSGQFSSSLYFK